MLDNIPNPVDAVVVVVPKEGAAPDPNPANTQLSYCRYSSTTLAAR
jgi:hypothetical protein